MSKPLKVAYDISRLSAGGVNGGIKVHHYEFLRCFVESFSGELQLHVFCQEEVIEELAFLSLKGTHQIHVLGARSRFEPRDSEVTLPVLHYWPQLPEALLVSLEIDLLYAGFGFSRLYTPEVPQVSLIVDVLHRAYPESLPPAEVAFRDKWYAEALERSTLVQTNSEYCKQQLVQEFGADPAKIFTISLPLHGRFDRIETGTLPPALSELDDTYFIYPANYWPHKNHEMLIEAYRLYSQELGDAALPLVLTGAESDRSHKIEALINRLDLPQKVHQIGHLDLPSYKAAWASAKALLFPSKYEGFGIPLLEAQYFGKPIACCDSPHYGSFLESSALVIPADAPQQWAHAMKCLQNGTRTTERETTDQKAFTLLNETEKLLSHWLESAFKNPESSASTSG